MFAHCQINDTAFLWVGWKFSEVTTLHDGEAFGKICVGCNFAAV